MSIFSSERFIKQHHNQNDFKSYYVGYADNQYDWDNLLNTMMDALVDFVYGFHKRAVEPDKAIATLKRALFKLIKPQQVLKRTGEVGELLLHIILRDFFDTLPLLQKVYLKTNPNDAAKGFDIIHAKDENGELNIIFGEAKLYENPNEAIRDLITDLETHYVIDFMLQEFILIGDHPAESCLLPQDLSEKYKVLYDRLERLSDYIFMNPEQALQIGQVFDKTSIVLFCAFKSDTFLKYKQVTDEFRAEMEEQLVKLYSKFNNEKPECPGNIIFVLFPLLDHNMLINLFIKKMEELNGKI